MSKNHEIVEQGPINIVWLKRDLRLQDHAALQAAEQADVPYRIIYFFEPSLIAHPDTSDRHLQFCWQSIQHLNQKLSAYQRRVDVFYGEAITVFDWLHRQENIQTVFSYQESSIEKSWKRDIAVGQYFKAQGIGWKEFQRDGIVRGITNRKGWDKQWFITMKQPVIENQYSENKLAALEHPFALPDSLQKTLADYPSSFQPAGEQYAWKYLNSFTQERGKHYHLDISKPEHSRNSCGRLSPYLAWGNLSIKQAYQHIKNHPNYPANKRAFNGIATRLKWHCHFIQKFEVECSYEHTCVNRGYETVTYDKNPKFLEAWKEGKTGFPMVDACMRCLYATGWINFRMRAMLVSFLCHHLALSWKDGVYHLAQLFLDYEPGIHYTQFQMQAATTGINTIRIYNPVKQSQDNDPQGVFIKKWIPELAGVPEAFIHEPWKITALDLDAKEYEKLQQYPHPIVNIKESASAARKRLWGYRSLPAVKAGKERVLKTHTRPNRPSMV